MKKHLGIIVAAALAAASTAALARDDAVKTARKQADATYKMDKKACRPLKGDAQDRCMSRAKAEHDQQMVEVKNLEQKEKADDKDARAEAKRHASGASAGSSSRPMPGSQGEKGERTAVHPPLSSMGKAPVSANSARTGDPKVDQPPK